MRVRSSDLEVYFLYLNIICHNKMILVNCAVEENDPTQAVLDTSANVNSITQKHISELRITYNDKRNRIVTPDVSYSTLGKVNLCITFNGGKKHKSIPSEFIVVGPDWPDHFPNLTLEMPWLRENGATLDICNSKLLLDDNFAIPIKEVKYEPVQNND